MELAENAQVLIEKAQAARVEKQLVLAESLEAPVEKGQKVGTLVFTLDGEQIAEVPSWRRRAWSGLARWIFTAIS